jgi:hypothetical protein
MKNPILLLILVLLLSQACTKENSDLKSTVILTDTLELLKPGLFLKNIPINSDTIYMDKNYGIDFRVHVDNYKIHTVRITLDNLYPYIYKTTMFNSLSLPISTAKSTFNINFKLYAVKDSTGSSNDSVVFESGDFILKVVENLSERYVHFKDEDGSLKITWPELDKDYTQNYLIERLAGDKEIKHEIVAMDSLYTDPFYVGEEVTYNISVINKDNIKQKIWHIHRKQTSPKLNVKQNGDNGYILKWNKCRYTSNLSNYNFYKINDFAADELLFTSSNANDTTYILTTGKFGEDARFRLEYIPKVFPTGITKADTYLYSFYLSKLLGEVSLVYDQALKLDENTLVYTRNGIIYKYSISQDKTIDSIFKSGAHYGFLSTTPAANYLYAADENIYGSPIYIWPAASFQNSPLYTFLINFLIPPVSDALTTIMGQKSATTDSKIAICNVTNGAVLYGTSFQSTSNSPRISSNGQSLFIFDSGLGLYEYKNNTLTKIWEEANWTKFYKFYNFDPLNPDLCYVWSDDKIFSIKNTHDYSTVATYSLDMEEIKNFDFNTRRIMGYGANGILIFNLANGSLLKQIPAGLSNLFFYSNNSLLVGNTIFNNNGIKYNLNLK